MYVCFFLHCQVEDLRGLWAAIKHNHIYVLFYLLNFLIFDINYIIHRNILICWKFYKLIELC